MKRIVIVGGGFAGVYTARALETLLREQEAEIVLVNREDYFVFQPLLPEVISGSIALLDTVAPIRRLCSRTRLYFREVEKIDLVNQTVWLVPAFRPRSLELPYDYLVIAAGSINDFSAIPGLSDHGIPFRTLGDALRVRNAALQVLEEADNESDEELRGRSLTFVVAGGGFSGVEAVAELNDFLRTAARSFRRVKQEEIRCVLVHSGSRILPEITPSLADYAQKLLVRRGVTLKLNARLSAATAESVLLSTGETIGTRTVISTVPSAPVPLVVSLSCAKEKGKLPANNFLELKGYEGRVWVAGDCASIPGPDGSPAPPTAQHASRQAEIVAKNITATIYGTPQQAYGFAGLGKLGSLGHHSAVAEILGFHFSGIFAWFLWRTIYLLKFPGLDRKLRVGLDWLVALFLPPEIVQLRVQTSSNISSQHFEPGEMVFEEGDLGVCMYVVRSGEVEVLRNGARLALLGPGEYFGEMALLSNRTRSAAVRAIRASDVLVIPRSEFRQLLAIFPEFGITLSELAAKRETAK